MCHSVNPSQNFTFPHLPTAPVVTATGAPSVPPLVGIRPTSPCQTPSGRRQGSGHGLGPWARSKLLANSGRHATTWASTLRSPCNLTADGTAGAAADAGASAAGGALLTRSNSCNSVGVLSGRGVGAAPHAAAEAAGPGIASGARPGAWGSPSTGQVTGASGSFRETLSYRGAVLASPQQSPSPRVPRPPVQNGPASASPRSSLNSLTPRSSIQSAGKSRAYSPGMSPDSRERGGFGYHGGENMQPGFSTPRVALGSASAEGKGSQLASMYKEKAAMVRERSAALRVSMHKNWEHQDAPDVRSGGQAASGNVRSSINGSVGTTGAVTSSLDGKAAATGNP